MVKKQSFALFLVLVSLVLAGFWSALADGPLTRRVTLPLVVDAILEPQERAMTVANIVGQVDVLAPHAGAWSTARLGQTIQVGSAVRTMDQSRALIEITEGSSISLGFGTTITLTQLSAPLDNPVTVLTMGWVGDVVFDTPSDLGEGMFKVELPYCFVYAGGIADLATHSPGLRLGGGGNNVGIDANGDGFSDIPVFNGMGTVTDRVGDLMVEIAGNQRTTVGSLFSEIPSVSGPLTPEDMQRQSAMWCMQPGIDHGTSCNWTATPTATKTRTPTCTPTREPQTSATPTRTPTMTPRPTRVWPTPDPEEPLSVEEMANQGTHTYNYTAFGYGACEPSSPAGTIRMTFTFSPMAVTVSSPDGGDSTMYAKISRNVYQITDQEGYVETIEFRSDGWDGWVDTNGIACLDLIYRLAD